MRGRRQKTIRVADDSPRLGRANGTSPKLWMGLLLLLATFAVYSQVHTYEFINYDDPGYVTDNPQVRNGLSWNGTVWAFTAICEANWFPVTWLSHMLDVQLFGMRSGWHHMVNVLIHALSTLLLFFLLLRITGALWKSAFVAFVFALHPLHVESVAWITERKDVLCGLFCFLTLWAYVKYTERPGILRYAGMLLLYGLGLMSKQMIVTLPAFALLLDAWPLRRLRGHPYRVIFEKLPMCGLAAAGSAAAYIAQHSYGAIAALPLSLRIENALTSYWVNAAKLFWPANLAIFYPYPSALPLWQAATAAVMLAAVTALVLFAFRRRPYLAIGWLWYLIGLAPVIGIVQVGLASRADRFTYLPMIGISIMLAWGIPDALETFRHRTRIIGALAAIACSGWLIVTWFTVQHWRNSISVWQHAIEATRYNFIAYNTLEMALLDAGRLDPAGVRLSVEVENSLSDALLEQGKTDEAMLHISRALRLQPDSPQAHIHMGDAQYLRGKFEDAESHYRTALRTLPDSAAAHLGLGSTLAEKGKLEKALPELEMAARLKPEDANAHNHLGKVYGLMGRMEEAESQFSEAIHLDPKSDEAHYNLGTALAAQGRLNESLDEFQAAIGINPGYLNARNNLGSALANLGRFDEAIEQFAEILRRQPDRSDVRHNLDVCLALRIKARKGK